MPDKIYMNIQTLAEALIVIDELLAEIERLKTYVKELERHVIPF